jgi:hypothetical protein
VFWRNKSPGTSLSLFSLRKTLCRSGRPANIVEDSVVKEHAARLIDVSFGKLSKMEGASSPMGF